MVVLWHEGTSHPAFNCRKLADEEKHAKNSSSMKQSGSNLTSSNLVVPILLRAGGVFFLGLIALCFPEVGPNRILLGLLLMFVVAPIAALLEFFLPMTRFGPTQPPFDIAVCETLIHLTPSVWIPALIAGGLSANSTSVHLCRNAFWHLSDAERDISGWDGVCICSASG